MNKYIVVSSLLVTLCSGLSASAADENVTSSNSLQVVEVAQSSFDARRNRNNDARLIRDAQRLRNFISDQVGGLENLIVPATDADIPQPLLEDGSVDPFFANSPERRFLGQQLFYC